MSDVTAAMDLQVEEPQLALPPGFRFHPTDEEVVSHYLTPKVLDHSFSCLVVADVDLNECEPCDLPGRAKMGEKEWYFFVHKSRKYPTGTRTNRATRVGYWKATGRDKEIFRGKGRAAVLVGMKKTLVFYRGRAPRGVKTPWVMHEYRLEGKLPAHLLPSAKDEWAVCRVINKDLVAKNAPQMAAPAAAAGGMEPSDSMFFIDDLIDLDAGLPPLMDSPFGTGGVANDDEFTAASSSTSGAAAPPEPRMGYMVKTEQPAPAPAPAQETQSQYYFSMPAATHGAGYPQYQDAIRRDCRRPEAPSSSSTATQLGAWTGGEAQAPPSLMPSTSRQASYQDLEELFSEPLMDYSNLWNI